MATDVVTGGGVPAGCPILILQTNVRTLYGKIWQEIVKRGLCRDTLGHHRDTLRDTLFFAPGDTLGHPHVEQPRSRAHEEHTALRPEGCPGLERRAYEAK